MNSKDAQFINQVLNEQDAFSKPGQFTKKGQQSSVKSMMNEFRSKAIVDSAAA